MSSHRNRLACLVIAAMASVLSGCASLSMDAHEHRQQIKSVARQDYLAMQEDLDLLFQTERGTRLTRWHDR